LRLQSHRWSSIVPWLSLLMCPALSAGFDCVLSLPQKDSHANAFLVFQGRAVEIKAVVEDKVDLVTFEVSRIWKGPASKSINVVAITHPAMGDGYTFTTGTEYIVYATKQLNHGWPELDQVAEGARVYGLNNCVPRVRMDIAQENKILGRHWRKP
jgi:hypothetical protein